MFSSVFNVIINKNEINQYIKEKIMLFILIVLLIVENIILAYKFRNKLKQIITKFFKRHDVKNIQLKNETDA